MLCGSDGDKPYIITQLQTGDIYATFYLRRDLSVLIQNVSLETQHQMYYQQCGTPHHFSHVVRKSLNSAFLKQTDRS
jgi:hypothetical protein